MSLCGSHGVRHAGTQARRQRLGRFIARTRPQVLAFPCSPRIGVQSQGTLEPSMPISNRVDCLSTENPEETTDRQRNRDRVNTYVPHPSGFQRATTRNSSHVNTHKTSLPVVASPQPQPLPHHVQPLLWHVSTSISDSFVALASTRCHRLLRSTALEHVNSPLSSLSHGTSRRVIDSNGIRRNHSKSTCLAPPVFGCSAP